MLDKNAYKKICSLSAILLLVLILSADFYAAPGNLDLTFSLDGKLTDGVGRGNEVAIQSDGKIVVAGEANGNFAVARYNTDGSPDTGFGAGGKVITQISSHISYANSVTIQMGGKIVAAGFSRDNSFIYFTVVRYNPNGSLDSTFDGDGIVQTRMLSDDYAEDVAIQSDGKIIVAGCTSTAYDFDCDNFALARYNPDGSLDTTFDSDGRVITPFGFIPLNQAYLHSITIQMDGKIVAVGYSRNGSSNDFTVVRYNMDGSLDPTFDFDGKVTTAIGSGDDRSYSVAIQLDGKIVVAGYSSNGSNNDFAVVRYNSNGSLDTTFDFDGKVTTPIGPGADLAHSVEIQTDGKIVAAGYSYNGSNNDFALARYNPNGSLDTTFGGGDGKTTADFDISNDNAYGMALDNAGRAVVVGESDGRFAIARFLLAPRRAIADFDGDGRADISVFRPSNGTWYLNQSTNGLSATQFGASTDKITPADYDGDGKTDVAVFRDGLWYLQRSSLGFTGIAFGEINDIPMPADYDGDGKADIAVFRPSNGVWYIQRSQLGFTGIAFGQNGDKAVPADYDGDGKSDMAVFRNGTWYLLRSTLGLTGISFGESTDRVVPADYDGDGLADVAVFRPSNGVWYLQQSTAGFTGISFGFGTDVLVPADYDGDGKTDIAVFRPSDGNWYQLRSSLGFNAVHFGANGDIPIRRLYFNTDASCGGCWDY